MGPFYGILPHFSKQPLSAALHANVPQPQSSASPFSILFHDVVVFHPFVGRWALPLLWLGCCLYTHDSQSTQREYPSALQQLECLMSSSNSPRKMTPRPMCLISVKSTQDVSKLCRKFRLLKCILTGEYLIMQDVCQPVSCKDSFFTKIDLQPPIDE